MFGALKNLFISEKCYECGQIKTDGKTDIYNKFRCNECLYQTEIKQEVKKQEVVEYINKESKKEEETFLTFFDSVCGLDTVKENLFRTLQSSKAMAILLLGPPASCKTLFMSIIRKKWKNVLYFDAANGSGAGLIEALHNSKNLQGLIIDEVDKLRKNEMNCLLGLLSNGTVDKILKGQKISFSIPNLKVFATANSNAKLSKPIRSRFSITYNIPKYTDEEFIEISKFCLKDTLPTYTAELIANILLKNEINDIRAVINVSGWIQKQDTEEDIKRVIEKNWLPFQTSEVLDYN